MQTYGYSIIFLCRDNFMFTHANNNGLYLSAIIDFVYSLAVHFIIFSFLGLIKSIFLLSN